MARFMRDREAKKKKKKKKKNTTALVIIPFERPREALAKFTIPLPRESCVKRKEKGIRDRMKIGRESIAIDDI